MIHDTEDIVGLRDARRLVEHIRNRAVYALARPDEARQALEEIHEAAEKARPLVQAGLQSLVSSESRRIELDEAYERSHADRLAEAGFGPRLEANFTRPLAPRSAGSPPADEPGDDDLPCPASVPATAGVGA